MKHRRDIDGLRAVAILPVLFYHANIWPFAGGYVGVDVFFVLSGYLITGLILRGHADGAGFSLADFYDRRIRRILPALAVVLAAAGLAALFVLLPDELASFGKSLIGSALFYANVLYWLRDAAYFAPDAGQNPLLHIWSLSVEEQFYLFWPLLLVFLAPFRRALPVAVVALAAASLALACLWPDPDAVFYLLPTRAWQLLLGALLSAGALTPPRDATLRNAVALLGLALIAAAMLAPGGAPLLHSLGAAFGTAAILFAADGGGNFASTALATRVPVFIGLISYSLYLWHWPALVFARLYLNRELNFAESSAVLLAAFAASVLSWRFVEQPVRRGRGPRRSVLAAAAGGVAVIALAASFLTGLPQRVPPDVRRIDAEAAAPLAGGWCSVADACVQGAFPGEAVLWGDSHARALAPGLAAFAAARHLRLRALTRSACPPLPDLTVVAPDGNDYPKCTAFNRAARDYVLKAPHVRLVILQARWEVYFNETRIRPAAGTAAQAFSAALGRLMDTLIARRIAVLVIGNVPRFADVPVHCYGRERLFGRDPARCLAEPWAAGMPPLLASEKLLFQAVAPRVAHARYHPLFADLCHPDCRAFAAGHVLYADTHHLTPFGARLVGRSLDAAMGRWPG